MQSQPAPTGDGLEITIQREQPAASSQRVRGDQAVDGRRGDAAAPAHRGDSRRLMVDVLIGEEHGETGQQLAEARGFPT